MPTPNDTRNPFNRKLSPEELARFIAVNGYDPTTKDGLVKHIDLIIDQLNKIVDELDKYRKPSAGMTYEQAKPAIDALMAKMNRWGEHLTDAKAMLGEFVYKEVKGIKD